MPSPKIVKEVQQLTGQIARLNKFISKDGDGTLLTILQSSQGSKEIRVNTKI